MPKIGALRLSVPKQHLENLLKMKTARRHLRETEYDCGAVLGAGYLTRTPM